MVKKMSINSLSDLGNWIFIGSLVIGVLATGVIWYTAKKKEEASSAEIATLSEAAAQANARAAALELKSEELRRENLLLARAVAPRTLEQAKSSIALKEFSGTKVIMVSMPDFESRRLAGQIAFMLELANWKITMLPPSEVDMRDGVEIEFVGGGSIDKDLYAQGQRMKAASDLFVQQMEASSIDAKTSSVPIGAVVRGSAGQDPKRPLDELRIRVGLKPVPPLPTGSSDAGTTAGITITGNR